MITIPIAVCGDDWVNQQSVLAQLNNSNIQDPIVLDMSAEGPSLWALGIVDTVYQYLHQSGRNIESVAVINWSNSVETVPFKRLNQHLLSHFFWYSDRYRAHIPQQRSVEHLFGCFIGRRTVPRCIILKDIQQQYSAHFLLSLMNTVAGFKFGQLDPVTAWCDPEEFDTWWNSTAIPSLDNHTVRDQYFGDHNTNASLLKWYPKFDIELVAETYCHGDAFFVTEKTVRPIMAKKSLLVYGPQHYLARLQDLGFCTWGHIWDESYDQLTGPARWQAMKLVIDDLITRDQQQLYQQCSAITQHNLQHATTLIEKYRPQ